MKSKSNKDPWWKRRLEKSTKEWTKHVSKLEEVKNGTTYWACRGKNTWTGSTNLMPRAICTLYNSPKSKYHTFLSIPDNTNRIGYYTTKTNCLRTINLGCTVNSMVTTIWATTTDHNRNAEWLRQVKNKPKHLKRQCQISISYDDVKHEIRRITSWKAPELDGVHGGTVPEWLTIGRTVLNMKDAKKEKVASNYKPIAGLLLTWKLFTKILAEKISDHLLQNMFLPNEQRDCKEESRGTKNQLLIDKAIFRNCTRTYELEMD